MQCMWTILFRRARLALRQLGPGSPCHARALTQYVFICVSSAYHAVRLINIIWCTVCYHICTDLAFFLIFAVVIKVITSAYIYPTSWSISVWVMIIMKVINMLCNSSSCNSYFKILLFISWKFVMLLEILFSNFVLYHQKGMRQLVPFIAYSSGRPCLESKHRIPWPLTLLRMRDSGFLRNETTLGMPYRNNRFH